VEINGERIQIKMFPVKRSVHPRLFIWWNRYPRSIRGIYR